MTKAKINAGACGYTIDITCEANNDGMVSIGIKTDCSTLKNLQETAMEFDAIAEYYAPFGIGEIFKTIIPNLSHISCPVISAILKTMETEASLSVAQNVSIEIEKQ